MNKLTTYTTYQVWHYTAEPDSPRLVIVQRSRFWDWLEGVFDKPFTKSDYDSVFWGNLWDWAFHKAYESEKELARVIISKDAAEDIEGIYKK